MNLFAWIASCGIVHDKMYCRCQAISAHIRQSRPLLSGNLLSCPLFARKRIPVESQSPGCYKKGEGLGGKIISRVQGCENQSGFRVLVGMVCGLQFVVCSLQFVVCGLWFVIQASGFVVWCGVSGYRVECCALSVEC